MIRPSACRRMRVVRWSILNRSSSTSGSVAWRSMLVEHGELALQQRLVAPRQVAEHVVDALPEPRLVDRGPDGGLPHGVDRLADLADFVAADPQRRRLGRDVHDLAAAQPGAPRTGSCSSRQRQRGAAERGEPPVDGPAEQDRDEQREDEAGQRRTRRPPTRASWRRSPSCWFAASTVVAVAVPAWLAAVQPRRWSAAARRRGTGPAVASRSAGRRPGRPAARWSGRSAPSSGPASSALR